MGPCCHGMAHPHIADGGKPPIWWVAVNILNEQSDSQWGGFLQLVVGQGASNFPLQKLAFYETHLPRAWTNPLVQSTQCKRDMSFGTQNVRGLYRSVVFTTGCQGVRVV
jgi:hypothetical protein